MERVPVKNGIQEIHTQRSSELKLLCQHKKYETYQNKMQELCVFLSLMFSGKQKRRIQK